MLCEKCGQETESITCQHCGEIIARLGSFCYRCGKELAGTDQVSSGEESCEIDFSERLLCSDGTCIGVIDKNGICKVCGKPYTTEST